jgi:hypothetical protein
VTPTPVREGLGMMLRKMLAVPMLAGTVAVGAVACEPTTTVQDGLVNVNVGDVTILEDVNLNVAADVTAQLCGVNVDAVVAVIAAVDQDSRTRTICKLEDNDKVRVTQN